MLSFSSLKQLNRKYPAHETRHDVIKLYNIQTNVYYGCDDVSFINSLEDRNNYEEILFPRRVIKFYFDYHGDSISTLVNHLNEYFQNYFELHFERRIPEMNEHHFYIRQFPNFKRVILKNFFYMYSYYELDKFIQNFKTCFPEYTSNVLIQHNNIPLLQEVNDYNFDDFVHCIPGHLNTTHCIVFL